MINRFERGLPDQRQGNRAKPYRDFARVGFVVDNFSQFGTWQAGGDALDVEQHPPGLPDRQGHVQFIIEFHTAPGDVPPFGVRLSGYHPPINGFAAAVNEGALFRTLHQNLLRGRPVGRFQSDGFGVRFQAIVARPVERGKCFQSR